MILERLSTAPGSPLAAWAAGLPPATAREGVLATVAVRMLAQKGLEVPRDGYAAWRARLFSGMADPGGLQQLFEDLCDGLVAVAGSEGQERIAVVEVEGCPLEGLLLSSPTGAGHYVIAVSRSFATFANLLAKSCALAVPIEETPEGYRLAAHRDWARGLKPGSPAIARFMEMFQATFDCRPAGAPQYLPPIDRAPLVPAIRDAMELFMLSRHVATILMMERVAEQDIESASGVSAAACTLSPADRAGTALLGIGLTLDAPALQGQAPLGYWGIHTMLRTIQTLRTVATTVDDAALLAFLGPEASDVLQACRLGLILARGEDPMELKIAQTMEPATEAFFDAVTAWTDSLV